jgi:hypothetical protein
MVLLFVLAMALAASGVGATQPNFVILFGDDWGFGDMGANWNGTDGMPVDPKWPRAFMPDRSLALHVALAQQPYTT